MTSGRTSRIIVLTLLMLGVSRPVGIPGTDLERILFQFDRMHKDLQELLETLDTVKADDAITKAQYRAKFYGLNKPT